MLRKITIIAALFSFSLAIPCAVLAQALPASRQDATSTGTTRKDRVLQRIDTVKEKLATREAALRKKLDAFRDKRKAEVAQRVNDNLNQINKNQTSQMLKHLDKMSAVLNKLERRVNTNSPDVKDPAAVKAAISEAKTALDTASATLKAQAGKDYTLQITSESRVKADAQKLRESLHEDLKAARQLVVDTKQVVANAIRISKGLGKEATSSGRE